MNREFYDNEREIDLTEQKDLHRREKKVSWARVGVFLATVASFAVGYDYYKEGYWGAAVLFLIFLRIVSYHNEIKNRQKFLTSRLNVLNSYIVRARGTWRKRSQDGSHYLKNDRPQDVDLYIFGAGSIFQYICAARTKRGRDRLAESLSPLPPKDFSEIRTRQHAVAELLQRPRLSLDLEAYARLMPNNHDTTELIKAVEEPLPPSNKIYLLRFLPLPIFLLQCFLTYKEILDPLLLPVIPFVSLITAFAMLRRTSELLKPLQMFSKELKLYQAIFERLESTDFSSRGLTKIRDALTDEVSAAEKLKLLSLIVKVVNARKNPVAYVLGNSLFLLDFFCAAAFLSWRATAANHLRQWLDAWSEAEVLMSFASIGQTRDTYCFPKLLDGDKPRIKAKNLSSLLIADKKAVENSADLRASTTIITGANMSGKTTWIRTLASAVLLAYAGAPVCAESFSVSRMAIFTSIRVNDDISQGMSTFYAELLRIKAMIEYSEKKLPMLICIDEIFKGTNENDRLLGAREAIKRLTSERSITLVTTHDFELCEMTSPNDTPIFNSHFQEYYEGDKIKFDFKLREGRCTTTNAKYLLKMTGILIE
ncbi:MAG: DNA mismatch repair protein MutS [Selenomonadaceae bacterium]|nr:DNA mismatch repair protein MutS [Selenomonadaceae bacterium]